MTNPKVGILLTNIGTPAEPTPAAVRRYLKQFLSDSRVVQLPAWLWQPILHGIILQVRPKASAKLYQKIWTSEGSPLLCYSKKLAKKLEDHLNCPVLLGMQYSEPSIEQGLLALQSQKVAKMIVLPLYPQYSGTTTAATFDAVVATLKKWQYLPSIEMISHYSDQPEYVSALSQSIQNTFEKQGKPDHLLFSFHGIPERYAKKGDPYPQFCHDTAAAVAHALQLLPTEWSIAFQSRIGRAGWLTPYTDQVLASLPQKGVEHLQVICPGFAVDCLETLEEMNIRGREQFLDAGGKSFYYIPALNDSDNHVHLLSKLLHSRL